MRSRPNAAEADHFPRDLHQIIIILRVDMENSNRQLQQRQ